MPDLKQYLYHVPIKIVVAVALGVVLLIAIRSCQSEREREYTQRVAVVTALADVQLHRADSLEALAGNLAASADSLAARALTRDTVVRVRVQTVRDTVIVPDTCLVYVAQRDAIIDELLLASDTLQLAFSTQNASYTLLNTALHGTRLAADSLRAVLDDRPKPLSPLIPTLDFGVYVGYCFDGAPCAGVGVGITWTLPIWGGR